jgi:hypothetical protein
VLHGTTGCTGQSDRTLEKGRLARVRGIISGAKKSMNAEGVSGVEFVMWLGVIDRPRCLEVPLREGGREGGGGKGKAGGQHLRIIACF